MTSSKIVISAIALALTTGCMDTRGPEMQPLKPQDVLAEVRIRSNAIMIAKGDSHKIAFDLIAMDGSAIPIDTDRVRWASGEQRMVSVRPDGVIEGLGITDLEAPVLVALEYEHKYVTKHDTVSVHVTEGRIDADAIRLISLDSNRIGSIPFPVGAIPRIRVDLFKDDILVTKGASIPIQVDEPAVATLNLSGGPQGEPVYFIENPKNLIGKFWIRSSLNLYGNEVNDSLSFTGLYQSLIVPFAGVEAVADDFNGPIPLLDTIPLNHFQTCGVLVIMNVSPNTIDVVFSDSTASSDGCESRAVGFYPSLGLPFQHEIIGGNVLNLAPFSAVIRRSNTIGVISYTVRNSLTKQTIPWFINHFRQIEVED